MKRLVNLFGICLFGFILSSCCLESKRGNLDLSGVDKVSVECDSDTEDYIPLSDIGNLKCVYAVLEEYTEENVMRAKGYVYTTNLYAPIWKKLVRVASVEFTDTEAIVNLVNGEKIPFYWKDPLNEFGWADIEYYGEQEVVINRFLLSDKKCSSLKEPGCSKILALYVLEEYNLWLWRIFEFKGKKISTIDFRSCSRD